MHAYTRILLPLRHGFLQDDAANDLILRTLLQNDPANDLILESIDMAAERLGCSRRTVYELIARGEIRTVRVASRQMIPRGERLRFVRDQLNGKKVTKKKAAKKKVAKKKVTKKTPWDQSAKRKLQRIHDENRTAKTKLEKQCAERKREREDDENRAPK
jgi:excisionase family DNA binding protein